MRVLFVCTGNTCRSPMAAALAMRILSDRFASWNWEIESAGLQAYTGQRISSQAKEVLQERGLQPLRERAQALEDVAVETFDSIIAMTETQALWIKQRYPAFAERIGDLMGTATGVSGSIEDPFGLSLDSYRRIADQIEYYLEAWCNKLQSESDAPV